MKQQLFSHIRHPLFHFLLSDFQDLSFARHDDFDLTGAAAGAGQGNGVVTRCIHKLLQMSIIGIGIVMI